MLSPLMIPASSVEFVDFCRLCVIIGGILCPDIGTSRLDVVRNARGQVYGISDFPDSEATPDGAAYFPALMYVRSRPPSPRA